MGVLEDLIRVRLLFMDRRLNGNVPSQHPEMAWLVECVADIETKYLQGADGRPGRECSVNKWMRKAWTLENESCGATTTLKT